MNIINSFLLNLFLKPLFIYRRLGADIVKLRAMLTYKLIMDDRQPLGFGIASMARKNEPVNNTTWLSIFIYLLMGLVFTMFFFFGKDLILQGTVFFGMYIVMLTLSLIIDFTRVLIDVKDNFIILPKPVDERTVLMSRIVHIAIHLSKMLIPLSLPATVVVCILHGAGSLPGFLLAIILATLCSIFLINATYLFVLHVSKPEKFKTLINYLQIGFTILIYGSYQLLPRLFNRTMIESLNLNNLAFANAIPSYWFAALWQFISGSSNNTNMLIGSLMAFIMPGIGIYAVVKVFAPTFNQKLTLIANSTSGETIISGASKPTPKWGDRLSSWFAKSGAEQMGFDFSWRMMLRSREFKMQVYPGIGYIVVLLLVLGLDGDGFKATSYLINKPENRFGILAFLYSPALLIMATSSTIHLSPSWKASWMYRVSHIQYPGKVLCGSIKAMLTQFMMIPVILIGLVGLTINGMTFIPLWIMAVALQIMLTYLVSIFFIDYLPFSQPPVKGGNDGNTVGKGIIAIFLIGVLVFIHLFIFYNPWIMVVIATLSSLAGWALHNKIKKTTWKTVKFAK